MKLTLTILLFVLCIAKIFAANIPYQPIGVTYNGLHDTTSPSVTTVNADLNIIKTHQPPDNVMFKSIRTYYSAYVGGAVKIVPEINKTKGLTVLLGLYIDNDYVNKKDQVLNDYNSYVKPYLSDKSVIGVLIGNEDYNNVTKSTIINYLKQVKKDNPNMPVGTAQTKEFWMKRSSDVAYLASLSDFIAVNIYPEWVWESPNANNQPQLNGNSLTPVQGFDSFKSQYHGLVNNYPGKQIVVTETGWPTTYGWVVGVAPPKQCQSGLHNAKEYFNLVSAWAAQNKVVVFYYSMFDDWYGINTSSLYNMHFGLLNEKGQPKQGDPSC
ncbi:hypothetical protein L3V83_04935 [Thiotrichales bacterium 19X7-9]|nr:hypothetical protein [Thiotrichales bacterium 19X7-9]